MKGDFSRDTFDPKKHFSRVLMQQGRVQLDADWNEQGAILLHYLRTLAKDILGAHAGPADNEERGFDITVCGRSHETETNEGETIIYGSKEAKKNSDIKTLDEDTDIWISLGRYYVEGILVENNGVLSYREQLGIGSVNQPSIEEIDWKKDLLFYLDVWEREITYVQDPYIREVALGGVDTCSRSQVVWQVKALMREKDTLSVEALGEDWVKKFNLPLPLGTGKMRARAGQESPRGAELCVIPPQSRYRGAENQLYRVEIHCGGKVNGGKCPTFKWSRENGAIIFPIRAVCNRTKALEQTLELEHLGRDQRLSLKPGDWVEYMDEHFAMRAEAGPMAKVKTVDRADLSVTLSLLSGSEIPYFSQEEMEAMHPFLRRWDHPGDEKFDGALEVTGAPDPANGWVNLEDGVQVWFSEDGEYRTGDYWLIPARVATGNVEWPAELDTSGRAKLFEGNKLAAALEPRGPRHYYAPLAIVKPSNETPTQDCRCTIKTSLAG